MNTDADWFYTNGTFDFGGRGGSSCGGNGDDGWKFGCLGRLILLGGLTFFIFHEDITSFFNNRFRSSNECAVADSTCCDSEVWDGDFINEYESFESDINTPDMVPAPAINDPKPANSYRRSFSSNYDYDDDEEDDEDEDIKDKRQYDDYDDDEVDDWE